MFVKHRTIVYVLEWGCGASEGEKRMEERKEGERTDLGEALI